MKNLIKKLSTKVLTLMCFVIFYGFSVSQVTAQEEILWSTPYNGNHNDWVLTFIQLDEFGDEYVAYTIFTNDDTAEDGYFVGIAPGTYSVELEHSTTEVLELEYSWEGYSTDNWISFWNGQYTIDEFVVVAGYDSEIIIQTF